MVSKRVILYFVVVVSAFMVSAIKVGPCEPDCTGHVSGDKVEDPMNCTQYYYCMPDGSPTSQSVPCPNGTAFNPASMACDGTLPCNATCGQAQANCHLTCLALGDFVSDPVDCSVYYECGLSGTLPPQSCPSSMPHFDGEKCVNDESVCCKPSCEPYCEAEGIQVADPTDCTKYFICAPEPIYPPFSCPAGEFFDIGYGRCTDTAECKAWCSATPSTPVISDSTPVNPVDTIPVNTDSTTPSNIATTTTPFIPIGTTTTPGDCITNLLCESSGFFSKCVTCQPEYFYCSADGEPAIEESCNGNLVFNPVPGYPYCILPGNCPYAPFEEYTRTYYTYVD